MIGKSKRGHNFIQIKFSNGVCVLIYSKGGFKLTVNDADYNRVLEDLPGLINYLRISFGSRLFENELTSSTFKVTQLRICIHAELQDSAISLSVEKISNIFNQYEVSGILKIPFENFFFNFEKDDFKHLDGVSHFQFEIFHNSCQRGHIIIYNNFRVNLITKYSELITDLFIVISRFISHVQDLCIKTKFTS